MSYSKGGSYEGDWVNGIMQGQGTKTYSSGDSHQGTFEQGKLVGSYTHRNPRGKIISTTTNP